MKKLLAFLLAMVFVVLVGCNDGATSSQTESTADPLTKEESGYLIEENDQNKISIMLPDDREYTPEQNKFIGW